jgi:hypothetical protein
MPKAAAMGMRVGVAMLGIVMVLQASIALWAWSRAAKDEAFYRERPLLNRMRQQQGEIINASAAAREVLLDVIPLGTGRDVALARLRQERFDCKTTAETAGNADLRRRVMESRGVSGVTTSEPPGIACQIGAPQIVGHQLWIVALQFDAADQLTDAVVRKWTISV